MNQGRGKETGGSMQLAAIYTIGALCAAGAAYVSGPEIPAAVFWLYIAGAVLFAIAAVGQYLKVRKGR